MVEGKNGQNSSELPLDLLQSYCVGSYIDPEEDIIQVSSFNL